MSLVGFKARNHPQQVGKCGAKLHVDDMATPPELFDPLNVRFDFTLDVAASSHNTKCENYFSIEQNGLEQLWCRDGERIWCNPPYSNIGVWVAKALQEANRSCQNRLRVRIVMLLPANRTEQRWWQDHVEPNRDGRTCGGPYVEFLPGRPRFIRYEDGVIRPNERPPFGCCLLIWG